jgi:nucleotidyltransferase/DNA polymerase involved in DNA repair
VVAAASYEARAFGVHSAMPSITAKRKCPDLIFVKPRFDAYKAISLQIREIFAAYTLIIEPLSLDEAYLDVTENLGWKRTAYLNRAGSGGMSVEFRCSCCQAAAAGAASARVGQIPNGRRRAWPCNSGTSTSRPERIRRRSRSSTSTISARP